MLEEHTTGKKIYITKKYKEVNPISQVAEILRDLIETIIQ